VRPVTPEIALLARRVAGRLALDRAVRVIESSAVSVPVMVGWLKPIVLLPAVALSGLTPTQIEALIAHELAHVRRHDYVVNLLQAAVETLLFYHPAVWWVSKQVRTEREHCCDDLAVRVCDRLVYVSALSDLAAMGIPKTALAATGGSLLARVRRILGAGDSAASNGGAWVPALVALVVLGAVAPAWGAGVLTESTGPSAHALNAAVIEEAGAKQAPPAVPAADALDTQLVPIPALPHFPTVFEALSAQGGSPQDERALAALIEQIQKQSGNEKLKEKLEIDRRRLELERARAESDAVMRLKTAEFELAELVKTHSRMSQLRENGLIAGDELAKLERRMQELEARLMNEREQMSLRIKERALEREAMAANQATLATTREADLARLYAELHAQTTARASRERQITEAQAAELERLAKQYQEVIEAFKATRAQEMAQLQERARVVQGRAEAVRPSRERMLLAETVPVTSEKEPIRSGDVLSIEISGESGLPTAYAVQTDGTVRLPILGSIKVAGLTAQQAGEAIRKQVARVNSSASVHVTLRRPRTEERRQR
jgi:protein involved in polysaccharide export with SLBB domain